jgi:tetratricopeptide (TPR) repeat protein
VSVVGQSLKINASLEDLQARAHADSNDPAAYYNLALGYWSKKKYDEAEAPLRTALDLDPDFAAALFARALLPRAQGKAWTSEVFLLGDGWRLIIWRAVDSVWNDFARQYRRAVMVDPLLDTRLEVSLQTRAGYQDRFDRASNDYSDGKFQDALHRYADILTSMKHPDKEPQYQDALWGHAMAAAQLAQYDSAIANLQRLVEFSQNQEHADTLLRHPLRTNEYRYVLAYVTQKAGYLNDAARLYEEALGQDIGLYMAHVRLAEIYQSAGRLDAAIVERRRALETNPEDANLLLDLGTTLARAAQWADAETTLRQAAAANPRDARIEYRLGVVEQQLGKNTEARDAFTQFLALAPSRYQGPIADAKQRLGTLH